MPEITTTMGPVLDGLMKTIQQRRDADPKSSYTANLFSKGTKKIAQKVGEEGIEAALAAATGDKEELVKESADLLYHLMVLWVDRGIDQIDIIAELAKREGVSGIDERASRP